MPHDRRQSAARKPEGETPEEFHACTRKNRYATRMEAKHAADACSRRKDAPAVYVYECELCGGWHLTHRKPRG